MLVGAAHVVRALQHDVVVLLVACLAGVAPYLNALRGKMAYDDKVRPRAGCLPVWCVDDDSRVSHAATIQATLVNPDVVDTSRPLSALLTHDFWGNPMWPDGPVRTWSHKSYRPLTVLTLRLDNAMWGLTDDLFGTL